MSNEITFIKINKLCLALSTYDYTISFSINEKSEIVNGKCVDMYTLSVASPVHKYPECMVGFDNEFISESLSSTNLEDIQKNLNKIQVNPDDFDTLTYGMKPEQLDVLIKFAEDNGHEL